MAAVVATAVVATAGVAIEEHADRRKALAERIGEDSVAVVFSAPAVEDGYRQNPSYDYLTGLSSPGGIVLLQPGSRRAPEVLYLPHRDRERERWVGPALGPGDLSLSTGQADEERKRSMELTGFGAVRARTAFERELMRALRGGKTLWVEDGGEGLDEPLGQELELVRDVRDRLPGLEVERLGPALAELRLRKSPAELERLREAAKITMAAVRAAAGHIAPGRRESEVRALIEYVFVSSKASGPSFTSIVGSGPNSTVLHYAAGERELGDGELVLIDVGASFQSYAGDVTRTFPVSGRFSRRQREIYDIVLKANEAARAAVKPGARLRGDVHRAAREVIVKAGYGDFFPHSTSHYVGLEVHDVGPRDGELEAGMVITIEPGIYLPDEALGVRIEDMVLVTEKGFELLTEELPREAKEIERLMKREAGKRLRP